MTAIQSGAPATAVPTKRSLSYWKAGKYALALAGAAMLSPLWRTGPVEKSDFFPPAATRKMDNDTFLKQHQGIPLKPLSQNCTNACGTTALAMGLNSLAAISHQDPDYQPLRHGDLDPGNREMDAFSAPDMLVRVAEAHGAKAQMMNNSTYEEIDAHVQKGHPVIALITEARGTMLGRLHYVVIYKTDGHPDPMRRTVTYANPATGKTVTRNYREFVAENASHVAVGKWLPTGFNRFVIVLSSQNDLGAHRDVPLTNVVATGVSNLINNVGMVSRATQNKVVEPLYALLNPSAKPALPVEKSPPTELASR